MKHIRALLVRLRSVFGHAAQSDAEFDSELESHLHMLTDEYVQAGIQPDEARRRALLALGGLDSIKETYRDRRGIPVLETTLQDLRYAWRALRRGRGAAVVGIAVMALAIGANTAVFSVVHAVLIDPLPYPRSDRIVRLSYRDSAAGNGADRSTQVSIPDVRDWQEQNTAFAAMSYYSVAREPVLAGRLAEFSVVASVTPRVLRRRLRRACGRAVLLAGGGTSGRIRRGDCQRPLRLPAFRRSEPSAGTHAACVRSIASNCRRVGGRTCVSSGCRPLAPTGRGHPPAAPPRQQLPGDRATEAGSLTGAGPD